MLRLLILHSATITRGDSLLLFSATSPSHIQQMKSQSIFTCKNRRQRTNIDGDSVWQSLTLRRRFSKPELAKRYLHWNPCTSMIAAIIYTMLDRLKRDNNIKKLLKYNMSLWSYCIIKSDMADLASCHNNTRRFSPSFFCHISFAHTTNEITIYFYMQESTATDQYWWRFGLAKFDTATTIFEARTRQAVSSLKPLHFDDCCNNLHDVR